VTSYTSDGYGRVRTVTDADGSTVTVDYDSLDRVTKVTYPDATDKQIVYSRLAPEKRRDRLGRWSQTFYDALRRPVVTRDPLGRTTTQQWCNCGSLEKLIDANNNATTWEYDTQGRATKETRVNDSYRTFTYESTTSRLKSMIDAKGQTISYTYNLDDNASQVAYTNEVIATPDVSYSYDLSTTN
jgi:YD repeat-containing protein